jgi:serine/threonine protein phosphatase 1
MNQRILVISDIHGMLDKLNNMLLMVKYNPKEDKLILLGDYVDRGTKPIKTIQRVMELVNGGAVALIGNHEDMFLHAVEQGHERQDIELHIYNGGRITQDEFFALPDEQRKEILNFICSLPALHEIGNYIFVHAGLRPGLSLAQQNPVDCIWIRDEFICGASPEGKTVIFGHTPTKYMNGFWTIWRGDGKIGIDCGAAYGGRLACLELPTMREYYC